MTVLTLKRSMANLLCLLLAFTAIVSVNAFGGNAPTKRLTRAERAAQEKAAAARYAELRRKGVDEVSHTEEAAALRKYQLRKKKRKGLLRKKEADLASVLFPGVSPEVYADREEIMIYTDVVNSKKTQVPFEFYDLPECPAPIMTETRKKTQRKNLGACLQGLELKPAPYAMKVKKDVPCTPVCLFKIKATKLRWLRRLVERQYRVQLTLDSLPVLVLAQSLMIQLLPLL